ncbi:unnamed protein product [Phytophthora fragariaefolia]|uniref:Unnamed protein product n=1 Tax=Phytophthora fragariaefolia TaxID=1490495 RepID=A0A9W6TN30_9STRA|nr:unnamed protein product [Phytophthora fragariaefolia]
MVGYAEGRERGIAFESHQLKTAEKNYSVHDKELLGMKYALVKFRVHLLGSKLFVIYTDHASLRTATQSPYLSQRMARWLSFFAEYNYEVKYKPGKQNALADALTRRPDYDMAHVTTVTSSIPDRIRASYASDDMCVALLKALGSKEFEDSDKDLLARLRARLHHYAFDGGLLYYSTGSDDPPRVVVPHDEDLKYRILYEAHDTPVGGHLGSEKTYSSVSLHYWWPNLYKWVGTYVRTCETCQRVKPAPHAAALLVSLPVPSGRWQSISMDFVFRLPPGTAGNTGVVVFVDRLSKMAHLAAAPDTIDGEGTATMFLGRVFRQHGMPEAVVSDRDPPSQAGAFLTTRLSVLRHVRDVMAESQDKQKEHADANGRSNVYSYPVGGLVLLNAKTLPTHAVSAVFKTKLRPRFIGPFKVVAKKGLAYPLNLPKKMRTHPVFYVGLLKPYQDPARVELTTSSPAGGMSQDSGLAEPPAGSPAGQSDHDGNPIVPEELGPSPAASAA